MNKLWVFGDSMSRNHNHNLVKDNDKLLWPAIIADKLNMSLNNLAENGIGNDSIFRNLINNLYKIKTNDYVIIGLTNPIRHNIIIDDKDEMMPFYLEYNAVENKRKVMLSQYQDEIVFKAHDKLLERDYEKAINIQKILTKLNIDSILWSWYTQDEVEKEYKYDRTKDYHFSYKGHNQFAYRLLEQINNKETIWYNIYERYSNI